LFRSRMLAVVSASAVLIAGCTVGNPSPDSPEPTAEAPPGNGTVVVYSGRNEELIGPLMARFEASTGIRAEVRYGDTAELAAQILTEGQNSPADVFFAQDAGALGALAREEMLAELPSSALDGVEERFRSPEGVWVGVSGRARVVAYNTDRVAESDLPDTILGFTDPEWQGRIGWAPTNGSFQSFVTGLRVLEGDERAREWLEGIEANNPKVYEGNTPALEAVGAGEVDVAFINHYYLMRKLAETGGDFPVANHFLTGTDPGALINVAGVGILRTASNPKAAEAFVDFLLGEEAQRYLAEETFEYPLSAGVEADPELPPLDEIQTPDIDLSDLADLEGTLELLRDAGVL
jgi:iron(III) transport system substrate-binding protein